MGRVINTLCLHHSAGPSGSVAEFRREHILRRVWDMWRTIQSSATVTECLTVPVSRADPMVSRVRPCGGAIRAC
jgi:hypothetical protein